MRHARTPSNAEARLQGRIDPALDDVGVEQARVAGEAIRGRWTIDRVVTTSRRRARATIDRAGFRDLPVVVDDRWSEIDFGDHDNRRISEVTKELGAAWASDVDYTPPNGESIAAMHGRVGQALADVAEAARDETILVVTHANPVKSAVAWLLGSGVESLLRMRVDLASITAFTPGRDSLLMTDYNWCPARDAGPG